MAFHAKSTDSKRFGPIPAARVYFPPEDLDALALQVKEILRSGRLTLGAYTEQFEKEFSSMHGRTTGIAVNSGTSALEIILRARRIEGADVIVPTNTFAATAFAVIHAGNRIVLADVGPDMFLNPSDLEGRITPQTRAVVAVHIGGRVVPDILRVVEICRDRGLALIEDAAHAHGSRLGDRTAGSFGDAAAFSFYPTKVITSGEGGMILTDDEELADTCRILRDQGKAGFAQNVHTELGYNWRLSEIQACVGLSQLRRLREFIEARRRIAAIYDEGLADLKNLTCMVDRGGMVSNYYKYIAVLGGTVARADIKAKLEESYRVSLSGEVYEQPLHEQPFLKGLESRTGAAFPVAEDLCRRHFCLPVYTSMTRDEAEYVVEAVREVVR